MTCGAAPRCVRDLNDLEWRLQHLPSRRCPCWSPPRRDEAGSSGYAASRRFLDLAAATGGAMRVDALVADRGGHNFGTWAAHLPRALAWLSTPCRPRRCPVISPLFDITGRVAVVTGSSRGIGLALAEGLAGGRCRGGR